MTIDINREYERFVDNWEFNRDLALRSKPPLCRWAYGACKEWIRDFEDSVIKTKTKSKYSDVIKIKKESTVYLIHTLIREFPGDELVEAL